jgi:hypothetical protein
LDLIQDRALLLSIPSTGKGKINETEPSALTEYFAQDINFETLN